MEELKMNDEVTQQEEPGEEIENSQTDDSNITSDLSSIISETMKELTERDSVDVASETKEEEKPEEEEEEEEKEEEQTEIEKEVQRLTQLYGNLDVEKAPKHWRRSAKAAWESAPLELKFAMQKNIQEQEAFIDKQTKAFKSVEKSLSEYDQLRDSVSSVARIAKTQPANYLKQLIDADKYALDNPEQFLINFARAKQIDLIELVNGGVAFDRKMYQAQRAQATLEERLQALEEENARLKETPPAQKTEPEIDNNVRFVQNFLDSKPTNEVNLVIPMLSYYVEQVKEEGSTYPDEILAEAYNRALQSALSNYKKYAPTQAPASIEKAEKARGVKVSNGTIKNAVKEYDSIEDIVKDTVSGYFNR